MGEIVLTAGADSVPDWAELRALIARAFAGMEGRIDPPSSLHRMSAGTLREMASDGFLVTGWSKGRLVACGFAAEKGDAFYLSKLAVEDAFQGQGIMRRMLPLFEAEARRRGLAALTLETRIELVENHAAFAALGFRETGRNAHPGYDRPTSLSFCRDL